MVQSISTSASNWSEYERLQHKIQFNTNLADTIDEQFTKFFGVPLPKVVPTHVQWLRNLLVLDRMKLDASEKQLLDEIREFEFTPLESSVRIVVQSLLRIFNIHITAHEKVKYGTPDFVVRTSTSSRMNFVQCVIETKPGGKYDTNMRVKYRDQLIAYILSITIENHKKALAYNINEIKVHKMFGILHIGLTPIFYKVDVPKDYVSAMMKGDYDSMTELLVEEYIHEDPYNDREFLRLESHNLVVKSYCAFKVLMENSKYN